MLISELMKCIQQSGSVVVDCYPSIEELETFLDPYMRGRITSITQDHDSCKISIDLNEFTEYNKQFMIANYYDKEGNPTLTAEQAGYSPKGGVEDIYVLCTDPCSMYFSIVEENKLYKEYQKVKSEKSYVQWLEEQVNTLRVSEKTAVVSEREEFKPLFNMVCDKENWKMPIDAYVPVEVADVERLHQAVVFFVGGPVDIERVSVNGKYMWHVVSPGYYNNIGA